MKHIWKIALSVLLVTLIGGAALFWFIRPNHIETQKLVDITVHTITKSYSDIQLIVQGDNYFLIDTGLVTDAESLDESIRELGYDPAGLRAIILTHGHHDHAGGALYFKQKYGVPIVAGAGDVAMLMHGKNEKICPTDFMANMRFEADQAATYPPVEVDVVIADIVDLEALVGVKGQLIPMAGHTAGSLVIKIGKVAFVGDMFRGSMLGDKAVTHFYMCDIKANKLSIKVLLDEYAPDVDLFFMGHFGSASRESVSSLIKD